jgi:precorrin-2/cobalt-factor-2 C20-methyltransferase
LANIIHGIGLGPGDPELLTVKAVKVLENSDVVVVPQSDKTGRSIAGDIVKHYITEDKIRWYHFPMTGDKADLDARYTALAEDMVYLASTGKKVTYVTIGDTPVYSTFNYLRDKLKEKDIDTAMIPGISAFSAAANRLNLPLCEKDGSFCVVEMPETDAELKALTERFSSVVLMKVHKRLPVLVEFVKNAGLTEAFLFQRVTMKDEIVVDLLHETPEEGAGYLSTAILKA